MNQIPLDSPNHGGRLREALNPNAQRIAFGSIVVQEDLDDLSAIVEVSLSHCVMLQEVGLLNREVAFQLMGSLLRLQSTGCTDLLGRPVVRGLYVVFEQWLKEQNGGEKGGRLHIARSRNDLNATVQLLILRRQIASLVLKLLRWASVCRRQGLRWSSLAMPICTQMQPAAVSTYGQWLAAIGLGILQQARCFLDILRSLKHCPLGAAAINGSTLPIAPQRTADLLGFGAPVLNSIDAIANKQPFVQSAAILGGLSIFVSRISTDFRIRLMPEIGWIELPDSLCGTSSFLPQKRNPWLLELARARAAQSSGLMSSLTASMAGEPYSNAVNCGWECLRPVITASKAMGGAIDLMRLITLHAQPNTERLESACADPSLSASMVAERIASEPESTETDSVSLVGGIISSWEDSSTYTKWESWPSSDQALTAHAYGGGPGLAGNHPQWRYLRLQWHKSERTLRIHRRRWKKARHQLMAACATNFPPVHPGQDK
jgi:argininosuccinate lyase